MKKRQPATVERAYALLDIKSCIEVKGKDGEDERIIEGIATTPTPDRVGDIVEPLGVKYKNPLPLLHQHRSSEPVGQVRFSKPTEDGIAFTAKMPKITEPGPLKDRVDTAWGEIKHGLVRGVSIGFRSIEHSFMDDGGIRFVETEVLELSLVTIPANADATIQVVRSIDSEQLAASGQQPPRSNAGVSASKKPVKAQEAIQMKKTLAEQISAFTTTRAAKAERMDAIMEEAGEKGETLDAAAKEEYDTLEAEIKEIDEHLQRLRKQEERAKAAAKPVDAERSEQAASRSREATSKQQQQSVISLGSPVPKGTAFTRYVVAMVRSKGSRLEAHDYAKSRADWHQETPQVELSLGIDVTEHLKAAVGAATTTDATWASPLVAYQVMASEFIELLRPATIIGRIPGLRRVPFNIQMPRTTTGSSVGWVGENAPKPVSSMAFDTVTLRWAKAAGIVVLTDELVRFSNPSAENIVRQDLIDAMAQFLDRQFVDPTVAEVTNVSPASITNGVTAVPASGTTAAAFRADVKSLFGSYFSGSLSVAGGVWIMTQTQALSLSLMMNSLGQPVFPNITQDGGTLLGFPVITSENIPATGSSPVDGSPIIFAKASEIMLADDGQVVIDASREASVQMDTAPDSPPTASTNMVSLWQMNMTGLRAERWINWKKRRSTAVAYISNGKYSE